MVPVVIDTDFYDGASGVGSELESRIRIGKSDPDPR
jgi:hypothetical protein